MYISTWLLISIITLISLIIYILISAVQNTRINASNKLNTYLAEVRELRAELAQTEKIIEANSLDKLNTYLDPSEDNVELKLPTKISYRLKISITPHGGNVLALAFPDNWKAILLFLDANSGHHSNYLNSETFDIFFNSGQVPQIWSYKHQKFVNELEYRLPILPYDFWGFGSDKSKYDEIKTILKGCYGFELFDDKIRVPTFLITPNSIGIIAPHLHEWSSVDENGALVDINFGFYAGTPCEDTIFWEIVTKLKPERKMEWSSTALEFLTMHNVEYVYYDNWFRERDKHYLKTALYTLSVELHKV